MDSSSSNSSFLLRKSYLNSGVIGDFSTTSIAGSIQCDDNSVTSHPCTLTQAELEEYSRLQYIHHQKQSSYAQSEGYHSYVSSTDSTSATPFLDRLRQESELLSRSSSQHWSQSQSDLQSYASTTNITNDNGDLVHVPCNENLSSTETLKWLGSMSDISTSSHATNSSYLTNSASQQLIAHSSRVRTPKRHNSESVLYMNDDQPNLNTDISSKATTHNEQSSRNNHRLFPLSTYTKTDNPSDSESRPQKQNDNQPVKSSIGNGQSWQSVAERINELERQNKTNNTNNNSFSNNLKNNANNQKFTYLDPAKTKRVPNMTLKAFQKNAVQSYFERQQMQQQQQNSPTKETTMAPLVNSTSTTNGDNLKNHKSPIIQHKNHINGNGTILTPNNVSLRPQSLPVNKMHSSIETLAQTRLSLPNKLSQIINLTTQLSAQKQLAYPTNALNRSNDSPFGSPIKTKPNPIQHDVNDSRSLNGSRVIGTDQQNNLQSMNESGVPPPPPRRSNRTVMPIRRTSSASEYSAYRDQNLHKQKDPSLMDGWIPERPPKNPLLRVPSPDLPPAPIPVSQTIENDEPLPLPPPEVFLKSGQVQNSQKIFERHMRQLSEPENKLNTANRRNSFAGSSTTRKPFLKVNNLDNLSPPLLPRKPNSLDLFNARPFSSMRQPHGFQVQQAIKASKVILNGKLEAHNGLVTTKTNQLNLNQMQLIQSNHSPQNDQNRIAMRKRTHNAPMTVPIEHQNNNNNLNGKYQNRQYRPDVQKTPSPIKSHMPMVAKPILKADVSIQRSPSSADNHIRSNSKASYLPRQSHEKLTSDPDHGSYKLTLNSNEDCIHLPHYNGQLHSTKINNLPDVLPLGVKIKGVSANRYGSNTTLTNGNGLNESVDKLHHHNHHHSNGGIHYQQSNGKTNQMMNSTKYISQSTMDLKRAHHLFNNNVNTRITNTESMGNLLDCTNHRQSSPPNFQHQMLTNNIVGNIDHTTAKLTVSQHNAMNTNGLVQAPFQNITNDKNKLMRCNNIMDSLLTSSHQREQDAKFNRIQTKLLSTQRIHHANISEINGDDALSTDDSSGVSQLSSESISSIESNSCKTLNESLINSKNDIDTLTNKIVAVNQNDISFGDVDYECLSPPKSMPLTPAFPSSECKNGAVNGLTTKLDKMATTSEAGSQTDESILDGINGFVAAAINMGHDSTPIKPAKTVIITRTRFADEFDCKKLTDSLVEQLSPNDRLRNILAPKVYKSSSDYVTGLYNPKMASRCVKKDAGTSMHREQRLDLTENISLVGYALNESIQSHQPYGNRQVNGNRFNREMQLINGDVCDLTKQKEELVIRLTKHLVALTNDRTTITDQNTTNDLLGTDISSIVTQKVRPSEASKFRSHVDDVGHITMLLLLLSGRLARIENNLFNTNDVAEKKILEAKRTRLLEQLDEAKRLKIDIDRRGRIIAQILEKNLTTEQFADYDYFINSKAKLIVDLQEVTDRIQLSEEQLNALKETLVHSEC